MASREPESWAAPHLGQNAKSASHGKPHAAQGAGCLFPHRGQAAKADECSKLQLVHNIEVG
jgi:hypothetical protein